MLDGLVRGPPCAERENQTVISGRLPDQPALHGVLAKIRDLGVCLISVRRLYPTARRGETAMRRHLGPDLFSTNPQIQTRKETVHEADSQGQAPSPIGQRAAGAAAADPRDPDIVHAHQVARRTSRAATSRVQSSGRGEAKPISGRR